VKLLLHRGLCHGRSRTTNARCYTSIGSSGRSPWKTSPVRRSDVDLYDGSIVVSKSAAVRVRYPDGPTKGGKVRNVFMSDDADLRARAGGGAQKGGGSVGSDCLGLKVGEGKTTQTTAI
jgi:hypothetical protein